MRTRALAAAACVVVGLAACSDDDRDDLADTAGSVVDDVQNAAESVVSNVQDATGEAVNDAAELVARNLATAQGGEAFENAGHPISGDLSCEASVTADATAVDVLCTGVTEDDGQAELTGTTDELPGASVNEISGQFVGTVDGAEVFTTDRLGG